MYAYIEYANNNNHHASQSSQSVMFTLFADEIITVTNNGINHNHTDNQSIKPKFRPTFHQSNLK